MVNSIKKRRPRQEKVDPQKLMELVVDEKLLEERKKKAQSKSSVPKKIESQTEITNKWNNLKKNDFIKKEFEGKFYGRHIEWKDNIWIGPYETSDELDNVINSYVRETKKSPINRNIKNIHSIIIDIK